MLLIKTNDDYKNLCLQSIMFTVKNIHTFPVIEPP